MEQINLFSGIKIYTHPFAGKFYFTKLKYTDLQLSKKLEGNNNGD